MKKLLIAVVALLTAGNVIAQENVSITNGQNIPVRLLSSIDSGMTVQSTPVAIVDANITDSTGQHTVISRGTPVVLTTDVDRARGLGKPGAVAISCVTTTAVDGQTIFLMGGSEWIGREREGLAVGLGVGLGIAAFPFGLFCLCIKGEECDIPANVILNNVVIDGEYTVRLQ